jgi:transcriptional regulator GlxA family with amidase domain
MGITIGILLFEDVEELDFAGPWEVFTNAARKEQGDRVVTIAQEQRPLRCAKGLRVIPDHGFADAPELDVLVVPGGQGARFGVENPVLVDWIRKASARCRFVASVCTGAYLVHAAGLASGRRITTHWAYVPALRQLGATVLDDVRYVRDGNLVTAAGVSAGIDMALWLVGQLYDPTHARNVQRVMQYDPAPPYAAEV